MSESEDQAGPRRGERPSGRSQGRPRQNSHSADGEPGAASPRAPKFAGDPDTREQLVVQARVAAQQAVQLARLAEESARLALRLNAQAFDLDDIDQLDSSSEIAERTGMRFDDADGSPFPIPAPHGDASLSSRRRRSVDNRETQGPQVIPHLVVHTSSPHDWRRARRRRAQSKGAEIKGGRRKSTLASVLLHVLLLVPLAFVTLTVRSENPIDTVLASFADISAEVEENLPVEVPMEEPGFQQEQPTPEAALEEEQPAEPVAEELIAEAAEAAIEPEPAEAAPETPGRETAAAPAVNLAEVGNRSETGKALLLQKYGGTAASESAVQRALEWFASRQRADGSWNFNDVGPCSHRGDIDNPMGATAYVLLCYLGAGQTHQTGKFKQNVRAGLIYLLANGKRVPAGGDFRGANCREHDNFYVQAAVAMVLSEAFQMTRDRRMGLGQAAQSAIDFLCHAQDPVGGGWRYAPQEPGCTSVTILVTMALQSARHARLKVPSTVFDRVSHYLDTVRSDGAPNGRYGYREVEPQYRSSTTAMALLGRMYLGWQKDNEELQKGIALLDARGPYDNLYYCYYATQVMKHWGGEEWTRWNGVMRDDLIRTQVVHEGPELGSWTPRDRSGPSTAGGRLFITCLATMTLEVYYRYLPLYDLDDDDLLAAEGPEEAAADDLTPDDIEIAPPDL